MKDNRKYRILWLDDELKVDVDSPNYCHLNRMREKAEDDMGMYIQTCITGNDFVSLAKDPNQDWDVFVIDAIGKMSDTDECPKDIFGKVLGKIDELVNNQGILLYCLTEEFDKSEKSSIQKLLSVYNFSFSPTGEQYYDYNNPNSDSLFCDIKSKLDECGKLFRDFPEIEKVYREIKRINGGHNEATEAITDMIKWYKDNSYSGDFEYGIREIINQICKRLINYGFYDKSDIKPNEANFSSVTGFYQTMMKRNQNNNEYLLSANCRLNWEATAMLFFGTMADVTHHALQKERGDYQDYQLYYKGMIFNAFVLFSKWYSRFKNNCELNGVKNTNWMFNQYYFNGLWPCEINREYQGKLKQTKDSYGNIKWKIRPKHIIDTQNSHITVDKNVSTLSFSDGRDVKFFLGTKDGNGICYAINVSLI